MDPAAPELSYESRIPSALQAGEEVLWERKPVDAEPLRIISSVSIGLAIIVGAGFFANLVSHDTVATVASTGIAAFVISILGVGIFNEKLQRRRKQARSLYRLTNRRILRIDDTTQGKCDELSIVDLARIELAKRTRGVTARFFDSDEPFRSVEFGGIANPAEVESLIISSWAATQRRVQLRRTRAMTDASPMMTSETADPDITLHEGEQVLWSGRPRPSSGAAELRRTQFIILVWMIPPILVIAAAFGVFNPYVAMPPMIIAGAIVWILLSLNGMLIKPRRDARRRRRTSYMLTTTRAIVRVGGSPILTQSYFLDIAKDAWLTEHKDGTGDVGIDVGATFERIENPADVYARVLQAIRTSGTIATSCATASPS